MLARLALIVISLTTISSAAVIPITPNQIDVEIPVGSMSILEFPFRLGEIQKTSLITLDKKDDKRNPPLSSPKLPQQPQGQNTAQSASAPQADSSESAVTILKGVNTLTLFSKEEGNMQMLIGGHGKAVVMLRILFREKKYEESDLLFSFYDPEAEKNAATKFETDAHSKVVGQITKHLYLGTLPNGYRQIVKKDTRKLDFPTTLDGKNVVVSLEISLERRVIGDRYMGATWYVKNVSPTQGVNLYEEIFWTKGDFGITIEADQLMPGEQTRLFVVSAKSED
jgi:hypothetical protein